ncbi:hypothetical protein GCM10010343_37480 [Streptomyces avidinii]|nr:hypothetical protein GCM10010343_37480 [Streptomyces avidinii]
MASALVATVVAAVVAASAVSVTVSVSSLYMGAVSLSSPADANITYGPGPGFSGAQKILRNG